MPNWCEGSLKLKGDPKDIRSFLIDRVLYDEPNFRYKIEDDEIYIDLNDWRWVKDTTRAFLTPQYINYYDDVNVINLCMSQAWGFTPEDWMSISKEYHLEIKLFGVEQGMQFTDYIYIKDGEIVDQKSDSYSEYEDFLWNVPFPNMGG